MKTKADQYKKLIEETEMEISKIDVLIEEMQAKKEKVQEKLDILLRENEVIRKYLSNKKKSNQLDQKLSHLFFDKHKMETELEDYRILSCNHIWITVSEFQGNNLNQKYENYLCLKCKKDTRDYPRRGIQVNIKTRRFIDTPRDLIEMLKKGIMTGIVCNYGIKKNTDWTKLQLIYDSIIETYPGITDEQAVEYLKQVVRKIRSRNTSEEEYAQIIVQPSAYVKKLK